MNTEETKIEKNKARIYLVTFLVLLHTIITINNFLFIIFFSIGKSNKVVDFIVLASILSFVLFGKCIFVDIYHYIKGNSLFPEYCEENYYKKLLQRWLRSDAKYSKDLTKLRLDILRNVDPLLECESKEELTDMFNFKMHYTTISVVLTILLLIKYNLKSMIPMLIIWFFVIFKI